MSLWARFFDPFVERTRARFTVGSHGMILTALAGVCKYSLK